MEGSFPRGGTKRGYEKVHQKEQDLFKVNEARFSRQSKKKRTEKPKKDVHERDEIPVVIEQLSLQTLSVGMIVLGYIQDVFDYSLGFVLPGGISGTVPIPNISDPYTRLLQAYAEDPENVSETVVSPPSMFTPGSCFPVKIVGKEERGTTMKILLSLNPKDVNESLTTSCLYHEMTLVAAVESIEDHGYIMDVGIFGLKGFLSSAGSVAFIQKRNEGRPLAIGQTLLCKINMPRLASGTFDERTIPLVAKHKVLQSLVSDDQKLNLHNLLPGVALKAEIRQVRRNGLVVDCFGFGGCIWKDHLRDPWDTPYKFEVGQQVECTLLFQTPMTHTLHLSLLPQPTPKNFQKRFGTLKAFDLVEEATVVTVESNCLYLKLQGNIKAMAVQSQLSDLNDIVISEAFNIGDVHSCRILQISHFEMMARVSLKRSVLRQHVIPLEDIKVGEKFEGIVIRLVDNGMLVKMARGVQGFVRHIHMADIPPSDPVAHFPIGKKVRCRVLRVDHIGERISPLLTCKKTLVKSRMPPLSDYCDAMPHHIVEGVVVKILDHGLVITFFGDVQGWAPKDQAVFEPVDHLENLFYLGQVVKCRILRCIPEEKRLLLTFRLDNYEKPGKSSSSTRAMLRFGQIYDATVTKKTDEGLNVKVQPDGQVAYLPLHHLSDHPKLCKPLLAMYTEGETVSRVVCFATKGSVVVSRKESLILASENGALVDKVEDIQPGQVLQGVVKGFATYGVFVDLGNGISGLAHIKSLSDGKLSHINDSGYITYSSIGVKILKVDLESRRLELSAKLKDVYDGDMEHSLSLLENFLRDWKDILQHRALDSDVTRREITKFEVGTIVPATVTLVTEEGIICDLGGDVKGFAVLHHLVDVSPSSGETYEALVLHVDVVNDCVELAMSPTIMKEAKSGRSQKVGMGKVFSGTVMLIRDHFILVFVNGAGLLVYLPIKKHTNDMIGYTYGILEEVSIRIAKINDGKILGTFVTDNEKKKRVSKSEGTRKIGDENVHQQSKKKSNASEKTETFNGKKKQQGAEKDKERNKALSIKSREERVDDGSDQDESAAVHVASANFKIGEIFTAVVTAVKRFQLNIEIGGKTKGRVHVTEIGDSISEGTNPLDGFKRGQEIEVRAIGYRDLKTHRFLVVSHRWTRSIPEFSLKEKSCNMDELQEGQEIMGFVREYSRSCLWVWLTPDRTGRINLMNLSQNPNVLRHVEERFPPSQAIKVNVLSADASKPVELTKIRDTKILKGRIVLGLVLSARRDMGVFVRLPGGYQGTIGLTDLRDTYKPASVIMDEMINKKFVRCCVLEVDHEAKTCRLSTRSSRFPKAASDQSDDPEIETANLLKEGMILRGFLTSMKDIRQNVTLGHNVRGTLPLSSFPEEVRSNLRESVPLGTVVRVSIKSIDENKGPILKLLDYESANASLDVCKMKMEPKKRRRRSSFSEVVEVKEQKTEVGLEDQGISDSKSFFLENSVSITPAAIRMDLPRLELDTGFDWNVDATPNLSFLVGATQSAASSSSESEDDTDQKDTNGKKTKRKSKKQKLDEAKQEEQNLFKEERRLMEPEWQPETVDDFDRMVATSPNNSMVWLKYMAFHLQQAEVEKARVVAERALKTICFRDEQEKLNIWMAMLNLENLYGTRESLNDIFQRALQHNEPIKVYTHMVNIYDKSEKVEDAEEMYTTMIKKFRKSKEVWIDFGVFYMKRGKLDAARQLMHRSLNSVEKRDHISIISKFAQLEFKLGDLERGKTMFEGIISSYPKRIDQWSIYIDMLLKHADVDAVRNLFERAITLSVSAIRMKFFFKRYLEFEQQHGDEEKIVTIRKKALEYVESKAVIDD